jgi:carboxyl-terminal processing protease
MKYNKSFVSGVAVGVASLLMFNVTFSALSPISTRSKNNAGKKVDTLLKIIDDNYIGEYDKDKLEESMYSGLVYGVGDPYTTYFDEASYTAFMAQSNGTFAGIGIQVSVDPMDNKITILSPFVGSPGEKAGLLPKDKLIEVNGQTVYGDTLDTAISAIKGEIGTSVNITIYRESTNKTLNMDIVRALIEHPTVSHKLLDDNVGYIRITNFEDVTTEQFMSAYKELNALNINGLIIDLRNNPGGLLHSVAQITDVLVPTGGNIVYTENKKGKIFEVKSVEQPFGKPLVLLVNGNSASASEVLTGAVKDYKVGTIVGSTTFGKGIVQSLIDLNDGSGLKITTAKYYTPNGISIHGEGIAPDYAVEMSDDLSVRIDSLSLDEDVQLAKGIEIMNDLISK